MLDILGVLSSMDVLILAHSCLTCQVFCLLCFFGKNFGEGMYSTNSSPPINPPPPLFSFCSPYLCCTSVILFFHLTNGHHCCTSPARAQCIFANTILTTATTVIMVMCRTRYIVRRIIQHTICSLFVLFY